jgi:segregation and condensation protein A
MSSSASPEPLDPSFRLKLPSFEGPLDLLLHLIQKHELDILNLPVAFVTERYLEYLSLMERLNLDIASEYLLMAAMLAHIKSKMLLPSVAQEPSDEAVQEDDIDPRAELIRRLLEYQKYKAAAAELAARPMEGRDVFLRGMDVSEASGPEKLEAVGIFKLLDAFRAVLERTKKEIPWEITPDGISIQERMTQLIDRLRARRRTTFDDLFDDARTVVEVVATFLAILEMTKRGLTRIDQSAPDAPIHIEYCVIDTEGETLERLDAGRAGEVSRALEGEGGTECGFEMAFATADGGALRGEPFGPERELEADGASAAAGHLDLDPMDAQDLPLAVEPRELAGYRVIEREPAE